MKDPYLTIGVDYEASDAEIKKKYYALAKKYHPDNFASDPVEGELANRKMSEINEAYAQIEKDRAAGIFGAFAYQERREPPKKEGGGGMARPSGNTQSANTGSPYGFVGYAKLRAYINEGGFEAVEFQLFLIPPKERDAEWHYLYSLTLLSRRHIHDAFREIGLACRMDPKNTEYKRTRAEMKKNGGNFRAEAARQSEERSQRASRPKNCCNSPCADCCFSSMGLEDREL